MCLYPFEHIQLYSGRRKPECHTIGVKNQSEEWEMSVLSLYLLGIGLRSLGLPKSTFTYNDTILALVPYFKIFPDKNQYF